VFIGFLPSKSGTARIEKVQVVAQEPRVCILYESPHRIGRTLQELVEASSSRGGVEREVVVARELTKKFEELYRGPLSQAASHYNQDEGAKGKGEFTVVLGPIPEAPPPTGEEMEATITSMLTELMREQSGGQNLSTSEAVKKVTKALGQPKSKVYRISLALKVSWGEE